MAKITHNISTPNDGLGAELRTAFDNQNKMNTELYDNKVEKETGKGLSSNDFTNTLKQKLEDITAGEANVQSDWNELDPSAPSYIIGKPIFETSEILVSAVWTGVGLAFDVSADAFPIKGVSYPATPAEVTLDPSDATLDRIDLIVAIKPLPPLTLGTVGKINGTPASAALVVPPDYDPDLYYVIKQVTVKAAATAPEGAVNYNVFKEGVEWDAVFTPNVALTTSDPKEGTYSVEGTNVNLTDFVSFAAPAPMSTANLSMLTFWIKLKEAVIGKSLFVEILSGGSRIEKYTFFSPSNFFDDSSLSYQKISIQQSQFNLPVTNFDEIRIGGVFSSAGYFIDEVIINSGSGSDVTPNSGLPEAPNDGKLYGRKNGAWQNVEAGVGDMSKEFYDPDGVEGDAFLMSNFKQPSASKPAAIPADSFNLWDSVANVFKKFTLANLLAILDLRFRPLEDRLITGSISGNYDLPLTDAETFFLTVTAATNFALKADKLPSADKTKTVTVYFPIGTHAPVFSARLLDNKTGDFDVAKKNMAVIEYVTPTFVKMQITPNA